MSYGFISLSNDVIVPMCNLKEELRNLWFATTSFLRNRSKENNFKSKKKLKIAAFWSEPLLFVVSLTNDVIVPCVAINEEVCN